MFIPHPLDTVVTVVIILHLGLKGKGLVSLRVTGLDFLLNSVATLLRTVSPADVGPGRACGALRALSPLESPSSGVPPARAAAPRRAASLRPGLPGTVPSKQVSWRYFSTFSVTSSPDTSTPGDRRVPDNPRPTGLPEDSPPGRGITSFHVLALRRKYKSTLKFCYEKKMGFVKIKKNIFSRTGLTGSLSPQRASRLFALTCPLCPSGGVQSRPSLARPGGPGARGRPDARSAEGPRLPQTLIQCPTSWTCIYHSQRHFIRSLYTRAVSPGLRREPGKVCDSGLRSCPGLCRRRPRCRARNCLRELTPGPAPAATPRPPPLFVPAPASPLCLQLPAI